MVTYILTKGVEEKLISCNIPFGPLLVNVENIQQVVPFEPKNLDKKDKVNHWSRVIQADKKYITTMSFDKWKAILRPIDEANIETK